MFQYQIDGDVHLKLLDENNAQELFTLIDKSRDYLRQWLPWVDGTRTEQDSRKFIRHSLYQLVEQKGLTTGIMYQHKLVGCISFNQLDDNNKIATIGYWLGADFQGKGIMTRAVQALTTYAFDELGMNRVEIKAASRNYKSRAIPERLHFTKEGCIRQGEWLYDHYVDHIIYGMLKHEWTKINKNESSKKQPANHLA